MALWRIRQLNVGCFSLVSDPAQSAIQARLWTGNVTNVHVQNEKKKTQNEILGCER